MSCLSIFFYQDNCLGCLNECYAFEYPDHMASKCPCNWSNFKISWELAVPQFPAVWAH